MGWSPFILTFVGGADEPVPVDLAVVRAVLEPHHVGDPRLIVRAAAELEFFVRAADGSEAEIFAGGRDTMVSRPHAGEVFGIIAELISRLGAVLLDPAGGAVCRAEDYAHLPADMRDGTVVVAEMTGETLVAALTASRRR
ncbi:hypothetical protein ACFW3D_33240 [Streptomyces sp. NPDC058864]